MNGFATNSSCKILSRTRALSSIFKPVLREFAARANHIGIEQVFASIPIRILRTRHIPLACITRVCVIRFGLKTRNSSSIEKEKEKGKREKGKRKKGREENPLMIWTFARNEFTDEAGRDCSSYSGQNHRYRRPQRIATFQDTLIVQA